MTQSIPPILLVGCGRMGGAMLAGWRDQGLSPSFAVDPAPAAQQHAGADLTVVADIGAIPASFVPAAVVLAVKPQNAAETLPHYARFGGQAVFLSIMAGRAIGGMRALLGDGAAIVRAILTLGHSLDLEVIAEGVETSDQLAFLRAEGCDGVQGYYFGRPMPAQDFIARVLEEQPLARSA